MKRNSEQYANKGLEFYKIIEKELRDRINDFIVLRESLEYLSRTLSDLENETNGKYDNSDFYKLFQNYCESIEMLEKFRGLVIPKKIIYRKMVKNNDFSQKNATFEELKELYEQVECFISDYASVMETIKPLKEQVKRIQASAMVDIDTSKMYFKSISQLLEKEYMDSKESLKIIEQVSKNITDSVEKGRMSKIFAEVAQLKTNMDLIRKSGR